MVARLWEQRRSYEEPCEIVYDARPPQVRGAAALLPMGPGCRFLLSDWQCPRPGPEGDSVGSQISSGGLSFAPLIQ